MPYEDVVRIIADTRDAEQDLARLNAPLIIPAAVDLQPGVDGDVPAQVPVLYDAQGAEIPRPDPATVPVDFQVPGLELPQPSRVRVLVEYDVPVPVLDLPCPPDVEVPVDYEDPGELEVPEPEPVEVPVDVQGMRRAQLATAGVSSEASQIGPLFGRAGQQATGFLSVLSRLPLALGPLGLILGLVAAIVGAFTKLNSEGRKVKEVDDAVTSTGQSYEELTRSARLFTSTVTDMGQARRVVEGLSTSILDMVYELDRFGRVPGDESLITLSRFGVTLDDLRTKAATFRGALELFQQPIEDALVREEALATQLGLTAEEARKRAEAIVARDVARATGTTLDVGGELVQRAILQVEDPEEARRLAENAEQALVLAEEQRKDLADIHTAILESGNTLGDRINETLVRIADDAAEIARTVADILEKIPGVPEVREGVAESLDMGTPAARPIPRGEDFSWWDPRRLRAGVAESLGAPLAEQPRPAVQPPLATLELPAMAAGGIVDRPTLALIGEAGPEKVTPLDRPVSSPKAVTQQNTYYVDGTSDTEATLRAIEQSNIRQAQELAR